MEQSRDGIIKEAKSRMAKSVEHLEQDLKGIRTGRAAPGLVDHIKVDYYGSMTPIGQLATVSCPDPKTLVVKPYDATQIAQIEKAILASDLGITPQSDGKVLRLPVPMLTKEQRQKLAAHVRELAEGQRVAIRNIRRDCIKAAQTAKKAGNLTEDDERSLEKDIQDITKQHEKQVDDLAGRKTEEIQTV